MDAFKIEKIQLDYGERTVLDCRDVQVRQGEIFGILGPNGAGKTTLFRVLNLLALPDVGEFSFFGEPYRELVANKLEYQRQMAMVFQKTYLFAGSVRDNVAYGLKVRGVSGAALTEKVEEALAFVGMEHLAHQNAKHLSGGEAQRVALARAMVFEPRVLFLDEPTSALDPHNTQVIENLIAHYNEVKGTTILIITHNIFQAKRMCHRLMVMEAGQMLEVGKVPEIFSEAQNSRSRAFLSGEIY